MPQIVIEALPDVLNEYDRNRIKTVLRTYCPEQFSTRKIRLGSTDFGCLFPVFEKESVPTHDVVVRIYLHPTWSRRRKRNRDAARVYQFLRAGSYASGNLDSCRIAVMIDFSKKTWVDENGIV